MKLRLKEMDLDLAKGVDSNPVDMKEATAVISMTEEEVTSLVKEGLERRGYMVDWVKAVVVDRGQPLTTAYVGMNFTTKVSHLLVKGDRVGPKHFLPYGPISDLSDALKGHKCSLAAVRLFYSPGKEWSITSLAKDIGMSLTVAHKFKVRLLHLGVIAPMRNKGKNFMVTPEGSNRIKAWMEGNGKT